MDELDLVAVGRLNATAGDAEAARPGLPPEAATPPATRPNPHPRRRRRGRRRPLTPCQMLLRRLAGWLRPAQRGERRSQSAQRAAEDVWRLYLTSALGVWFSLILRRSVQGTWSDLLVWEWVRAMAVAGATFPLFYRSLHAELGNVRRNPLRYFLAFQSGFFWETLMGQLRVHGLP